MNLKYVPNVAPMPHELFPAAGPGHRMNKRHWNTVVVDGSIPTSATYPNPTNNTGKPANKPESK